MSKRLRQLESRGVRLCCQECHLPVAEVRAGALVIRSRHHGGTHVSTFSLEWLERQLELSAESDKISRDAT